MKYKVKRVQFNSKDCIVCGLENPLGIKATFYETFDDQVIAVFDVRNEHQSYPNRLHGGMIAAVLDETIGRAINIKYGEAWGVTMELNVKYKKPVPLDQRLIVIGRLTQEVRSVFEGTGELVLPDGTRAAFASGRYMRLSIDNITDDNFKDNAWGYVAEDVLTEIDVPDEK